MERWTNKDIDELSMVPNILGVKYAGMGLFEISDTDSNVQLWTGYGGVREYIKAFEDAGKSYMQSSSDQEGS